MNAFHHRDPEAQSIYLCKNNILVHLRALVTLWQRH